MSQPILFYDIPSTAKGVAWSPNTWKTRYALNIKGIPYKTVWVEYPDIAALCQKIGASPTAKKGDGSPLYTLPAIFDPNTQTAVADSGKIARYLETTYPDATPRLIPAELDVLTTAFEDAFWGALGVGYAPVIIPAAFAVLCEGSKPYFRETREARLGGKLEELAPPGSETRTQVWAKLKKATGKIAAWYEGAGDKERLFVLGDGASVTYADVVVAGFFVWFKVCLGEDSEEWKEMASWDGGRWGKVLAAFEKYSAVDVEFEGINRLPALAVSSACSRPSANPHEEAELPSSLSQQQSVAMWLERIPVLTTSLRPPRPHQHLTAMEPIVFYDIPGHVRGCAWSPNTWKIRYTLNYKGLPYTTVWVEYPDIALLSKKIGVAPTDKTPDGSPLYTLPAIYDPNTKMALSESAVIVRYLDKTYPDKPTLIPSEADALHAAFHAAFRPALLPDLLQIMLPPTHAQLRAKSDKYFHTTREAWFGAKLEEFAPVGSEKRERHWKGVEKALNTFTGWLSAGGQEKLFFMGERISYADFTVAGFLVWIKIVLGEDSKEWQDVLKWNNGRWARFMEALEKYAAVDVGTDVEL